MPSEALNATDHTVGRPAPLSVQERRNRTLRRLGEVSLNPEPLLAVMNAGADDPDTVTRALGGCPVLTGRLLSVVNSSAFGISRTIDSIGRAVLMLGPSRTRALALAFGMELLARQSEMPSQLGRSAWVASLHKAAAARLAAEVIEPEAADRHFCHALIQDVGLPMLIGLDPAFYERDLIPGPDGSWVEQERIHFGLDHTETGACLLEKWGSSEGMVQSVRHHHDPPREDDARFREEGTDRPMPGRVVRFLASLLPHLEEEPSGEQQEWLTALHAQMLATRWPTPDAFCREAAKKAAPLHSPGGETDGLALMRNLAGAVARDTLGLIGQISRMESAMGRQREDLDELQFQAFTDPLTRGLNRRGFQHLAARRLEETAARRAGVCCLMLDLDDLKQINDTHGHRAGDQVLRRLAKLLHRQLNPEDLIGRLGGDEYAMLLTGVSESQAREAAERVHDGCTHGRVRLNRSVEISIRFSLGAVHVPAVDPGANLGGLLHGADAALYERKRSGKNGLTFHPGADL